MWEGERGGGGGKFRTEVCINARLNVIMRHTVVRTRAGLRFYNQHLVMLHSGPLITTRGTIPCTCSVFHVHIAVPLHIPLLYTRQVLIACLMQKHTTSDQKSGTSKTGSEAVMKEHTYPSH